MSKQIAERAAFSGLQRFLIRQIETFSFIVMISGLLLRYPFFLCNKFHFSGIFIELV